MKTFTPFVGNEETAIPAILPPVSWIGGFGIAILPLWMATRADVRKALMPILPKWTPEPITLCALFFGPARLTPKVQVLLDFLAEYIRTDRDPRLEKDLAKGYFTDRTLAPTLGP